MEHKKILGVSSVPNKCCHVPPKWFYAVLQEAYEVAHRPAYGARWLVAV